MSAMRSRSGSDSQARAWAEAMKTVDGFPMESDSAGVKTTATKLERTRTPANEFEALAGYKKVLPPF